MSQHIYLWVGDPQKPSEANLLFAALIEQLSGIPNELSMVYEREWLSIEELADGYTHSEVVKKTIVDRAQTMEINGATAMLGFKSNKFYPMGQCPMGLRYLGVFTDACDGLSDSIVTRDKQSTLYSAVAGGDDLVVREILGEEPSLIGTKNEVGHTLLMATAVNEQAEIARLLLNLGANVNDKTPSNGFTALHWALHHPPRNQTCVVDIVEAMLSKGADIDSVASNGATPLMLAAWFGAERVVALLLSRGANAHLKDNNGKTALQLADQRGHTEIVRLLDSNIDL